MIKICNGKRFGKIFVFATLIVLVTLISHPQAFLNNSYATPLFGTPTALSIDGFSLDPQIAVSGTDAYVVWQNEGFGFIGNISFLPIADSGATIGFETEINNDFGSFSPQIAASGTDAGRRRRAGQEIRFPASGTQPRSQHPGRKKQ